MTNNLKCTKKEFESVIGKIDQYTDYTGRKFYINFSDNITFYDTNWSGGTRRKYTAIQLENYKHNNLKVNAPWNNPIENNSTCIPEDIGILVESVFCGHEMGLTLNLNMVHQPKWIE